MIAKSIHYMDEALKSPEAIQEQRLLGLIQLFEGRLGKDEGDMALHQLSLAINNGTPEDINPREYTAFHRLIGSTIGDDMAIKGFDWEGETSVLATLEREARQRGWITAQD